MPHYSAAIGQQRPLTEAELSRAVFRRGQVCRLLSVSPPTVLRWLEDGSLQSYRLPCGQGPGGREEYRIPRAALVAFLRRHGLPQFALLEKESP